MREAGGAADARQPFEQQQFYRHVTIAVVVLILYSMLSVNFRSSKPGPVRRQQEHWRRLVSWQLRQLFKAAR